MQSLVRTQWLSEKEVAALIGLSISTLQKHRFRHVGIPYAKLGRSVRYAAEEVASYMEAHRIVPDPEV